MEMGWGAWRCQSCQWNVEFAPSQLSHVQPQKLLSTDWEGADIAAHHPAVFRFIAICVFVVNIGGVGGS